VGTRAKENKILAKLKSVKLSKKKVIGIVCVILAIIVAIVVIAKPKSEDTSANADVSLDMVTRGDVEVVITGSAAVEPNERYEIISMVSGDIISCPYDVGDAVNEGDVLYQFDTSSIDISMQKQELSLRQSEISYNNALEKADDLTVIAPCSGVISGMNLKVGDEVSMSSQIAQINNSRIMRVVLPFNETQIENIWIGLGATVTSSTNMGIFSGEVVDKASTATPQSDGSKLYDVTIEFTNPGAITEGQRVGGEVNGMISPGSGIVEYSERGTAKAEAEGKVSKIYCSNGDYVERGDAIIKIKSESVEKDIESSTISYQNAKLSHKESQEKLDDYSITSPISGTVITKNSKAGDTIDKTNSTQTLMVVADVSKLKFELAIDELDVSKIDVGQTVEITCDALANEVYYGAISQVSVEGTATNGVTTYNAEVIIDKPGNLRPSMNVDASVIVEKAENVLRVPTSDIKTAMGHSFVFVKDDGNTEKKPQNMPEGERPEGKRPEGEKPAKPEGAPEGTAPEKQGENTGKASQEQKAPGQKRALPEAPEGFRTVEVTVGVSGEDFTEVKSGLNEGDMVYSQNVTASSSAFGGMMGGGMMGGGMGGGMMGGPGGMNGGMGGRR